MALGELLAVRAVQQRQVRIQRAAAACGADAELLWPPPARAAAWACSDRWSSPAHHMRDLGIEVVDRDGEVVQNRAVGTRDHGVVEVDVLEARVAADRRRARPSRPRRARAGARRPPSSGCAAEAALGAVLLLVGLHILRGRARAVGVTGVEQRLQHLAGGAPSARSGGSAPRPSRAPASAASRGSARRSRAWSARGRCPRSAARARRPQCRASSQLNSAVRAPPMCSAPVGDGAKRTLIEAS